MRGICWVQHVNGRTNRWEWQMRCRDPAHNCKIEKSTLWHRSGPDLLNLSTHTLSVSLSSSLSPSLLPSFSLSLILSFSPSLLFSPFLIFSHLFSTFLLLSFSPSLSLSHSLIRSRWVCEVKEFTISQRRVLDSKAVCGWVVSDSANYRLSWAWPCGGLRKGMHHDTASYCIHLQRYCIFIFIYIYIWSKEV